MAHAVEKNSPSCESEEPDSNTTPNPGGDPALTFLLNEQYDCTEAYCNSMIFLHNNLQSQSSAASDWNFGRTTINFHGLSDALVPALEKYQNDIQRVILSMESLNLFCCQLAHANDVSKTPYSYKRKMEANCKLLQEHLARSHRVLKTISHAGLHFHPNGLPKVTTTSDASGISFDCKLLVALATLRASVHSLHKTVS